MNATLKKYNELENEYKEILIKMAEKKHAKITGGQRNKVLDLIFINLKLYKEKESILEFSSELIFNVDISQNSKISSLQKVISNLKMGI